MVFAASTTGTRSGDEDDVRDDCLFAVAIVHSAPADLPFLGALAPLLRNIGFDLSLAALLFVMGHSEKATAVLPEAFRLDTIEATCLRFSEQPASAQMTLPPEYGLRGSATWTLDVRPTQVRIIADPEPAALVTGEHLAGLLEVVSQALGSRGAVPMRSTYSIRIRSSIMADNPPRLLFNTDGSREFDLDIAVRPDIYTRTEPSAQTEENQWLGQAAIAVIASSTSSDESKLEAMAKDGVLGQVFGYPASARSIQGMFPLARCSLQGAKPAANEDWPAYVRTEPWTPAPRKSEPRTKEFQPQFDEVIDIIRPELWQPAGWAAMGFMVAEGDVPPILVFVFESAKAGVAAFRHICSASRKDPKRIRVSVVTDAPAGRYVVQISGEPGVGDASAADGAMFVTVTRLHGFTSKPGLPMLEMFRGAHERVGSCIICPGLMEDGMPRALRDGSIEGVRVLFRRREEVALENDMDAIALKKFDEDDDEPVRRPIAKGKGEGGKRRKKARAK